jgi:hypothetical protein
MVEKASRGIDFDDGESVLPFIMALYVAENFVHARVAHPARAEGDELASVNSSMIAFHNPVNVAESQIRAVLF